MNYKLLLLLGVCFMLLYGLYQVYQPIDDCSLEEIRDRTIILSSPSPSSEQLDSFALSIKQSGACEKLRRYRE